MSAGLSTAPPVCPIHGSDARSCGCHRSAGPVPAAPFVRRLSPEQATTAIGALHIAAEVHLRDAIDLRCREGSAAEIARLLRLQHEALDLAALLELAQG